MLFCFFTLGNGSQIQIFMKQLRMYLPCYLLNLCYSLIKEKQLKCCILPSLVSSRRAPGTRSAPYHFCACATVFCLFYLLYGRQSEFCYGDAKLRLIAFRPASLGPWFSAGTSKSATVWSTFNKSKTLTLLVLWLLYGNIHGLMFSM